MMVWYLLVFWCFGEPAELACENHILRLAYPTYQMCVEDGEWEIKLKQVPADGYYCIQRNLKKD